MTSYGSCSSLLIAFLLSVVLAGNRVAGNADEYIDRLLVNVREEMKQTPNLDPMQIYSKKFGRLRLSGQLYGLSTLHRAGSAFMQFPVQDDAIQVVVTGVFGLERLKANLDCLIKLGIFRFTHKMSVTATAKNTRFELSLKADINTKKVVLMHYKVIDIGQISIGNIKLGIPFASRVIRIITGGAINLYKQLASEMERKTRPLIQKALDKIGTSGLSN